MNLRANKQTQFSIIVTQLSKRTHSDKAEISFVKEAFKRTPKLYDNIGHSRVASPKARANINKNKNNKAIKK